MDPRWSWPPGVALTQGGGALWGPCVHARHPSHPLGLVGFMGQALG